MSDDACPRCGATPPYAFMFILGRWICNACHWQEIPMFGQTYRKKKR